MSVSLHEKWRKGGMTSNGLRAAAEVVNYTYPAGRSNILPDASSKRTFSMSDPISSIGIYQTRGTKQIAASTYGPGTLRSTNVQITNQSIPNDYMHGRQRQNEKRSQFVNYRDTDPILVENLRKNPLSIYAVGDAKNAPIPAFETYIRPDNYNTVVSEPTVKISNSTKQQGIDGSPQVNILGLTQQNPFLGLTQKINDKPTFSGKTYGGKDGSAKPFAEALYNSAWKTNMEKPIPNGTGVYPDFKRKREAFSQGRCKNDALVYFSPGYNVSDQVVDGKMSMWVGPDSHAVSNLPWGPRKVTMNPQTQQGGIWPRGDNPPATVNNRNGYQNNPVKQKVVQSKPMLNCYRHGDNESLVCN